MSRCLIPSEPAHEELGLPRVLRILGLHRGPGALINQGLEIVRVTIHVHEELKVQTHSRTGRLRCDLSSPGNVSPVLLEIQRAGSGRIRAGTKRLKPGGHGAEVPARNGRSNPSAVGRVEHPRRVVVYVLPRNRGSRSAGRDILRGCLADFDEWPVSQPRQRIEQFRLHFVVQRDLTIGPCLRDRNCQWTSQLRPPTT